MQHRMDQIVPSWFATRMANWRAGVFGALVIVIGLTLNLTVLGANPVAKILPSVPPAVEQASPVESLPAATAVPVEVEVPPVSTHVDVEDSVADPALSEALSAPAAIADRAWAQPGTNPAQLHPGSRHRAGCVGPTGAGDSAGADHAARRTRSGCADDGGARPCSANDGGARSCGPDDGGARSCGPDDGGTHYLGTDERTSDDLTTDNGRPRTDRVSDVHGERRCRRRGGST